MPRVFDRDTLVEYLDDVDLSLLLVIGKDETDADKIHQKAEDEVVKDWRVCLLVEDASLLEPSEKRAWGLGDQKYVSLGVNDAEERVVGEKGVNSHMMRVDGEASILKIRHAFAEADKK